MHGTNASLTDQVHLAQAQVALGYRHTPIQIDDSTLWYTAGLQRRSLVAEIVVRVHRAVRGRTPSHAGRA